MVITCSVDKMVMYRGYKWTRELVWKCCFHTQSRLTEGTMDTNHCRLVSSSRMDPYKSLRHTYSSSTRSKLPNTTAGRSQFTTMTIPLGTTFSGQHLCPLFIVHSENSVAFWVWKKNSCESSLCIIQPQKYKQILLLGKFGEEAVSRFAEIQACVEG